MKRVVLIGIMTILLLLPTSGLFTGNATAITGGASQSRYYNFTSLNVGTAPVNKSWAHFSTADPSNSFTYSIQKSTIERGLRIYNDNYTSASFLKVNLAGDQTYELHIEFSWYYSYVKGLTNNTLTFLSNGSKLFGLAMGPTDMETLLSNGSNSASLGQMMPYSSLITLDIFFNSSHNHEVYFKLKGSDAGVLSFPVKELFTTAVGSNISMEVGGKYANITIYNISEIPTINKHILHYSGPKLDYNSSHFAMSSGYQANITSTVQPKIDRQVNGVIFYGENNRLEDFNYYNSSYRNISGTLTGLSGGTSYGNSIYYWESLNNLTLFQLNKSSLTLSKFQGINFSGSSISAVFTSGTALFYNLSGGLMKENLSSHKVVFSGNLTSSGYSSGFRILSVRVNKNSLLFEGYSNNSGKISFLNYTYSSMKPSSLENYNYSTLNGGIVSDSRAASSSTGESLFSVKNNVSQNYLSAAENKYLTSPWNVTFSRLLASTSNFTLISSAQNIVLIIQGKNVTKTNIFLNSIAESAWSIAGNSEFLDMTHKGFTIYYRGPSLPLSNEALSIKAKSSYLMQGSSILNVSVESSLPFDITLNASQLNITLHNSSNFIINTSQLEEGNNTAILRAVNEAGYTSNATTVLEVDNVIPTISVSPGNNSYIANITKVAFNTSDALGIDGITVSFLNKNILFTSSNGSFLLEAVNITGRIDVTFMVEDGYGLEFNSTFSFTVPSFNASSRMNIWNGEYLSENSLNLSWAREQNTSSYALKVTERAGYMNLTAKYNYKTINLGNGNDTVALYANLVNGKMILLAEANVTVIAYNPSVSVLQYPSGIYSFTGNSARNNYTARIDANISSILAVELISPSGTTVYSANFSRNSTLNFSNIASDLKISGNYVLTYNATSPSGTFTRGQFVIAVNNSVPKAPVSKESTVYTNYSMVGVYLFQKLGLNYTATLALGNMESPISIVDLEHLGLPFGNGNYALNLTAYSDSGNHNSTLVSIIYYNQSPKISMSVRKSLIQENYTSLHYSISDGAPMQNITLHKNGIYTHLTSENGRVNLSFRRNGVYNISLLTIDKCGNRNRSMTLPVNVSYYIHLKSPHIVSSHSKKGWSFHISAKGNGIGRVSTKWYVDGKEVSNNSSLNTSLGFGIHTVRSVLTFQGHEIVVSKRVYVLGWIPYALASVVLAVVAVQRIFFVSRNIDDARKVISESLNLSLSDAIRAGRKKRLTSGTVKKAAFIMRREGKVSIEFDPDGRRFIMDPDWDKR